MKTNKVYICESTVHLITGFRYTKDRRPNSINKLIDKYTKDIQYAEKYLANYERHYMFWSPIVKTTANPVYDQMYHIESAHRFVKENYGIEIDWVINKAYEEKLGELRQFAAK